MFVHVSPEGGKPLDFKIDLNLSLASPEVGSVAQEIISEEASTQPEQRNVLFSPESKERGNTRRHSISCDTEHNNPATTTAPEGKHPEIFEQSIIYVDRFGDWTNDDCERQENRVMVVDFEATEAFGRTLYGAIDRSRVVDSLLLDKFPDLRDGMEEAKELCNFFEVASASSTSSRVSPAELKCYDTIFENITDGVIAFRRRRFDSSQMRTWFIASTLIQHPFFLDKHPLLRKIEMTSDSAAGLYMFVKADDRANIHKVTLESNLTVIDKLSGLPILSCEVNFRDSPRSHEKMFLQGLVACRQWRYILPESSKDKNMFLSLFIDEDFDVDLYLYSADANYNIKVFHDQFILAEEHEALRLARILFNYRDAFSEIAGQADKRQRRMLMKVVWEKTPSSPTSRSGLQSSRRNGSGTTESCTDPLLLSAEVRSLFCPVDTFLQGTKHEYVAEVRMLAHPFNTVGFVKLTNKRELRAFDAIRKSGSKLLLDRIILPTKVAEVSGHSIIFLPYGGDPLEYSWGKESGPLGHEMEIAWDLLNIVAHLHELHTAHLDIKPINILWDTSARSIRVIDFDSSATVDPSGSRKIKGHLGTPGFIAPEVELGDDVEYDPFLADSFCCGMVVSDMALLQDMTEESKFVLGLSEFLIKRDPNERWTVEKAMEVWLDWLKENGRPLYTRD